MDFRVQNVPSVHLASYCRVLRCCTLESTVPTGIMDSRVQNVPRVHPASYTGAVIIPETRFKRHRPVASTQLNGIPAFQARSSWATSWGGQRRLICYCCIPVRRRGRHGSATTHHTFHQSQPHLHTSITRNHTVIYSLVATTSSYTHQSQPHHRPFVSFHFEAQHNHKSLPLRSATQS